MRTDRELLEAWVGGNLRAGHTLFTRHFDLVRRFFVNKVEDPEDLIQSTFTCCASSIGNFRGDSSFRCFLLGIARNLLYQHWDEKQRGQVVNIDQLSLTDMGVHPTTHIARSERMKRLLRGLRRLPVEDQILLELYYWEQMTGQELAATMRLEQKNAETRLRRARLKLGQIVRRMERFEGVPESSDFDIEAWARDIRCLVTPDSTSGERGGGAATSSQDV